MDFRKHNSLRILVAVSLAALMAACASMGRPEGGPRDYDPPVFIRSNPTPGQLNVKGNRFEFLFNENVQLEDVINKVVISPAQVQMPQIVANGKRINVDLKDSLLAETTYTIDFSDAIKDLNEGNVLDGFAIDFSTGNELDSLRISGMVFQASNLEPAQSMLVGVYTNFTDTSLTTLPMDRIARTNQFGQFTIRGLKPGNYRLFAINDVNRDNRWNRSEDIAFYDTVISPSAITIEITDTLANSWGEDSLVQRKATDFLPNDILLTWFNEGYAAQYLKDYRRVDSTAITFEMATEAQQLPELTIVKGPHAGTRIDSLNSRLEASLTLDTLKFWFTDPELISADSLIIETRYMKTDTAENLSLTTDTLQFTFRRIAPKKEKDKKKDKEAADSLPPQKFIKFDMIGGTDIDIYAPLRFESSEPLIAIPDNGLHLEIQEDSLWLPVKIGSLLPDTVNSPRRFKLPVEWTPGATYRLTADSLAFEGIYGGGNKPFRKELKIKNEDDYASLFFTITDPEADKMVVQLLNTKDEPVRVARVINGMAAFINLKPETYYARGFIDRNGDGLWTTGNIAAGLQPEDVFYYPKKIVLKKNWEVEQKWNPFEMNIDLQKPEEIKKNKPKVTGAAASDRSSDNDDEENEEDSWDTFGSPGAQYNNAHRSGSGNPNMKRNTTRL